MVLAPMLRHPQARRDSLGGRVAGFTLLEMLVVLCIIAILATLLAPSIAPMLRGTHLDTSAQQVVGVLNAAREAAIARNRTVEVRIYQLSDPRVGSDRPFFRGIKPVLVEENGTVDNPPVALTALQVVSSDVAVLSSSTWSQLISSPPITGTEMLPHYGNSPYVAFRFLADGSLSLTSGQWTMTLAMVQDQILQSPKPANFFMIQLDPLTGKVSNYRP